MSSQPVIAIEFKKTDRRIRVPWWAVVIVIAWAVLIVLFNIYVVQPGHAETPCIFKNVTGGVPCPTCGSTRAAVDIWHGDVLNALWRNPLVLVVEVLLIVWVGVKLVAGYSIRLNATPTGRKLLWAAAALLFFANWAHVMAIDGPW